LKTIVHIAIPVSGVGLYIDLLNRYMDTNRFTNILISNKEKTDFNFVDNLENPIPIYVIPLRRNINFFKDISCLFQIIKILKEVRPDLIHCHSSKAGIIGRIAGAYLRIPTLYTPHAFSYLSAKNSLLKLFYKSIEKCFVVFPASILACSKSEYNRALIDLKFKKKNIYLWENSIEEPVCLSLLNATNRTKITYLCSVGRASYQKNFEMLIRTISFVKKSINDIQLIIIGIGNTSKQKEDLVSLIKSLELTENVTLIQWLDRREALSLINQSSIYLSSSLYEGLPYAVLEAISLSKPCIVTNVDGNKDLISDSFNGFLIEKNDEETMAQKIIALLKDKESLKRMSNNSKKVFIEKYNIINNIKKIEEIYLKKIA